MYNYIKGVVTSYGPNYISLENNGIGYMIYVPNPYVYQEDKEYTVYIYNHIREEEFSLYGFRNEQERDFFLRLINVKGVGPKLALPILASPVDAIYDAIERENILYLTKFPKVGDKVARQIILDLKGKLVKNDDLFTNDGLDELMAVLESLGYKKGDIKKILPQVDASLSIEQQIKAAKSQLDFYKNLGCGQTEDIQACQRRIENQSNQSLPSVNGYFRPIEYGYVTQWYTGCGTWDPKKRVCSGHLGIDISSHNKSIDVYPIAAGIVFARYYDSAGALVVKIKHKLDNGTYIYSTYAHQRNFKVSVGQYVSVNTSLGQMGSTGNSTGPHVHLEVTSCDWNPGVGCLWETYSKYGTYNPTDFVRFPSSWNNR